MKKIKFLFITFLGFVICFCCSGCISCRRCCISCDHASQKEFLVKEISKFEVEVEGYKLITRREVEELNSNTELGCNITYGRFFDPQYEDLSFQVNEELVQVKISDCLRPTIYYKDTVIEISAQYLEETCPTYRNIHKIWSNFQDTSSAYDYRTKEEFFFAEFDGKFFIMTFFSKMTFLLDYRNEYPATLYMYDFDTEQFLYAGSYLEDLEEKYLVVIKTEV